ncbi:MAG: MEKHLA domain-containing protein [Nitrosomonadales bacterium]|nr:MEKHLA domain-containing protein [Nitrosomonadales bacterium]
MRSLPPSDAGLDQRLRLMLASFRRLTGKALLADPPSDIAALRQAVWDAPLAIVAHGSEADPVFFYGNRLALQSFEMGFEEFSRLPSRLSAEPLEQGTRQKLLDSVTQRGYVEDYSGVRITSSGKRFLITGATVWNLLDETGTLHGQAAVFAAR